MANVTKTIDKKKFFKVNTSCAADVHGKKKTCSTDIEIDKIKSFLINGGVLNQYIENLTHKEIIKKVIHELGVDDEVDIYNHNKFRKHIGRSHADCVLREYFIPQGPYNSTKLLNNFNIDESLDQWAKHSDSQFGKKFYHVPFQMIDFAKNNTPLANLDITSLVDNGYKSFGVVLNTDISSGMGKHWFCIYGDLNHKGDKSDPYVLEYFNSSGFPPQNEIVVWMEKICHDLIVIGNRCKIVYATNGRQLQHSKTECGVWSLVYILSRLMNKDPHWLTHVNANDQNMIDFREALFRK